MAMTSICRSLVGELWAFKSRRRTLPTAAPAQQQTRKWADSNTRSGDVGSNVQAAAAKGPLCESSRLATLSTNLVVLQANRLVLAAALSLARVGWRSRGC